MKRTEYHREYYRKNIHRRQRVESKNRCKWREETPIVGADPDVVAKFMRAWA